MKAAKIFSNGASQAVRLPKEFQFATDEVYVNRVGGVVMLFPREAGWDDLAESLDRFSEDFMKEREQKGSLDKRKPL